MITKWSVVSQIAWLVFHITSKMSWIMRTMFGELLVFNISMFIMYLIINISQFSFCLYVYLSNHTCSFVLYLSYFIRFIRISLIYSYNHLLIHFFGIIQSTYIHSSTFAYIHLLIQYSYHVHSC